MDSIWFSIIAKDDSMIHQLCKKIVLETTHGGCHSYFDKRIDANFTALILVKWYYTDLKIDQYSKNWAFASNNFSASLARWKIFYTRKNVTFIKKVFINNIRLSKPLDVDAEFIVETKFGKSFQYEIKRLFDQNED